MAFGNRTINAKEKHFTPCKASEAASKSSITNCNICPKRRECRCTFGSNQCNQLRKKVRN